MSVLILSTSQDLQADWVERELKGRGVKVIRVDGDKVFQDQRSFYVENNDQWISIGGQLYEVGDISGVYVHQPKFAAETNIGRGEVDRRLAEAQWRAVPDWLESVLPSAIWLNRPSTSRASAPTLVQLRVAEKAGLRVPPTCYTNDPVLLRGFAEKFGITELAVKPGNLEVHLTEQRLYTNIVAPKTVTVIGSPCLFQEYIAKAFELRVHAVGYEKVLTCRIDSQASVKTQVDWRHYDLEKTPHTAVELDEALNQKLRAVTRRLGQELAIMDLIVTPEGEVVFLESNSHGYWVWIQEMVPELAIAEAIGDRLLGGR
jgi:hypothetical protein